MALGAGNPLFEVWSDGLIRDDGWADGLDGHECALGADRCHSSELRDGADAVLAEGSALLAIEARNEGNIGLFVGAQQTQLHVWTTAAGWRKSVGEFFERGIAGRVGIGMRELGGDAGDIAAELIGIGGHGTPGGVDSEPGVRASGILLVQRAFACVAGRDEWGLVEDRGVHGERWGIGE